MTKVAVAGMGEIGAPIASILGDHYDLIEIDVDRQWSPVPVVALHVCYPFQVIPDFESVTRAYIDQLSPRLTIVHSTVRPGTCERLHTEDHPVAYSPVRGKHARMREDLLHYQKFVASPSARCRDEVTEHLAVAGLHVRAYPETTGLELAKVLETSYFGILIAWAQEMSRFAGSLGCSFDDLWDFFEEVPYLPSTRFFPGLIGGHCVLPNIQILDDVRMSVMLDAVQRSNEIHRANEATP
jgi:UDP-N-acetyl-D-mannosaminuronate dehydrogenase